MKPLDPTATECGARPREGLPCRRGRTPGRSRCRLHGGAPGSGAPVGERNGRYTAGEHTKEAKAERRWISDVFRTGEGDQMDGSTAVASAASTSALATSP